MSASPSGTVTRRSDAERNHRSVIVAARYVFGQRGLDAPLDEIARRATLGNATLYRHFPTRCALVAAVFADTLQDVVDAAQRALDDPDPWDGFVSHVMFMCQTQASDRGLADLLTTTIPGAPHLEALRKRAYQAFVRIVDRAQSTGALRADFEAEDLILLLMANAGLIHRTAETAPMAWQRLVSYALDGMRGPGSTVAPRSPGAAALKRAMADQAALFGCT
jgi:AcrR family transcriptional regulator